MIFCNTDEHDATHNYAGSIIAQMNMASVELPPGNAVLQLDNWRDRMPWETWREVLESFRDDAEAAGRIYRHTNTGHPLGSNSLLSRLELALGRNVRPKPIGRPKGWHKKN